MVLDGSKNQTIRKKRRYKTRPGQTAYLFFGLRTKYCRKLGQSEIIAVSSIVIRKNGTVLVNNKTLTDKEKDHLAWADGFSFRSGSKEQNPKGSFDLMFTWWRRTHQLPFKGEIIYWQRKAKCRECGCTNEDCRQCIARNGAPCHWVEIDLCSACKK
jgi:hypothetical protein